MSSTYDVCVFLPSLSRSTAVITTMNKHLDFHSDVAASGYSPDRGWASAGGRRVWARRARRGRARPPPACTPCLATTCPPPPRRAPRPTPCCGHHTPYCRLLAPHDPHDPHDPHNPWATAHPHLYLKPTKTICQAESIFSLWVHSFRLESGFWDSVFFNNSTKLIFNLIIMRIVWS